MLIYSLYINVALAIYGQTAFGQFDYFSSKQKNLVPLEMQRVYNQFYNTLIYGKDPELALVHTLPYSIDIADDKVNIDRPLINLINRRILKNKVKDRSVKVEVVEENSCYIVKAQLLSVCFIRDAKGKWLIYKTIMMYPV